NAQTVKGVITDNEGSPLIGANVLVKGTNTGTISDLDGSYSIGVDDLNGTLVFSFVGFENVEVEIGGRSVVDLSMQTAGLLEEVVVVGYGTVKKSDLTGSVSSLKSKDFNPGATVSVDQLIQGRASGVQVTQNSGAPGGGLSIRVRGSSSINAGNEPLYVIDGFPIDNSNLLNSTSETNTIGGIGTKPIANNPLNALNPNDIVSIEILKDASSTAIYGSRGANGVVLITTKKGEAGRSNVNYDAYYGIQQKPRRLDILTTSEFIEVMNEVSLGELGEELFSSADISRIGAGTDWQDQVFQSAPMQSHNLSLSGGNDKTTYYASFNYFDQEGIIKETGMKRFGGRLNLTQQVSDRFKVGFNMNTSKINDKFNIDGVNINEGAGPIYSSLLYDPTEPVFAENGDYARSTNLTINNPLSLVEGPESRSESQRTFGNITLDYEILDGLSAKLNFGSDRSSARRDLYIGRATFGGRLAGGIADILTKDLSNTLIEYTMNYQREINENHNFNLLGGVTYQEFTNKTFGGIIQGFASDATTTNNLGLGDDGIDGVRSSAEGSQLLSYLGRVNYNLYDKFLFTASMRADGSSRFGENNKYGYFPSFAFAWKMTKDGILANTFSDLKFRASWGQTGNQEIGNFSSLSTFGTGRTAIFNNAAFGGVQPSRIANPDLRWEVTKQFNVGFDYALLEGRINGTIDYFIKNTSDLLLDLPLPQSSGFSSILSNVGSVENKGFEFLLTSVNVSKGDFKWSSTINFAAIKNSVTDIGELSSIRLGNVQDVGNTTIIREGIPINSYFGYEVLGIFNTADEVAASAQPGSQPGYPIFADTDGNGQITPDDQVVLGDPYADFTFGFQNSISYKGFQIDAFLYGSQGQELVNLNAIESMYPNNFHRNKFASQYIGRWSPTNQDARFPSGISPLAYGGSKVNTLTIEDASFIRLKTLQLSYQIPLSNNNVFQNLKVYVTAQNLFTITDYIGWDPEASSYGRSNVRLDYSSYPITKSFIFGVNAGF
ncbi:MAG: TonB-linked SusC/RagA family outer membrane protein, partial [Saprospiraceae bacterium]